MTRYVVIIVLFAAAGPVEAQDLRSPQHNSCVEQFYDAEMYRWLSYRNNCAEAIAITYVARNPPYGASSMTLRPGAKSSTGWSRSEVQTRGGFDLYVCPAGYLPVDATNAYVNRPGVRFRCRRN